MWNKMREQAGRPHGRCLASESMICVVDSNAAASYEPIWLLGILGEPCDLQYSAHPGPAATMSRRTSRVTRRRLRSWLIGTSLLSGHHAGPSHATTKLRQRE